MSPLAKFLQQGALPLYTLRKASEILGFSREMEEVLGYILVNLRELEDLGEEVPSPGGLLDLQASLERLENPEVRRAAQDLEQTKAAILASINPLEVWAAQLLEKTRKGDASPNQSFFCGSLLMHLRLAKKKGQDPMKDEIEVLRDAAKKYSLSRELEEVLCST